jgi:2-isopropylmalate synthase
LYYILYYTNKKIMVEKAAQHKKRIAPRGELSVVRNELVAPRGLVEVYDTTLRDGQQGIDVNYSVRGKLRVARTLQTLPVSLIEGGWPGANGVDTEFFQRARDEEFHPKLAAFGMTRRAGVHVESDTTINNLLESGAPTVTIVGKTDTKHVEKVFKTTWDENLAMIEDSVRYVREQGREVIYDAEHFFDGYNRNPDYALETLRAAARGGAKTVVLCDTNGGKLPWEIDSIVRTAIDDEALHKNYRNAHELTDPEAKIQIGIHTHADRRMAEANALTAVQAGATHVQGTIAGLGERAGNADLLVITDALGDMGLVRLTDEQRQGFVKVGRTVFEASGADMPPNTQLIGPYAFASKAGMHQDAMLKDRGLYNFREPTDFGNDMKIILNSQSGKRAVAEIGTQLGLSIPATEIAKVTDEIKDREHQGYRYTRAEGSLELLMRRHTPEYQAPFAIEINGDSSKAKVLLPDHLDSTSIDTVGTTIAAENNHGSTFFNVMRDALTERYPELDGVTFERYTVESENGTKRIFIKASNGSENWTTVGVGTSIAQAGWQAAADALEFAIYHPYNSHPTTA